MPSQMTDHNRNEGSLGWTDEREATLRRLWKDGLSAGKIAEKMPGFTRNAVIGKISRLGLTRSPIAQKESSRLAHKNRNAAKPPKPKAPNPKPIRVAEDASRIYAQPAPVPLPKEPPVKIEPRMVPLVDLKGSECKWPIGNGPFLFCGLPRHGERPYCAEHARVARSAQAASVSRPADLARSLRRYI